MNRCADLNRKQVGGWAGTDLDTDTGPGRFHPLGILRQLGSRLCCRGERLANTKTRFGIDRNHSALARADRETEWIVTFT